MPTKKNVGEAFIDWLQAAANDMGLGFVTQIKKNKQLQTLARNASILQSLIDKRELSLSEALTKFQNLVNSTNFDFHPALKGASLEISNRLFNQKQKLDSDIEAFNRDKRQAQTALTMSNSVNALNNPTRRMVQEANQGIESAGLRSDLTTGVPSYQQAADKYEILVKNKTKK